MFVRDIAKRLVAGAARSYVEGANGLYADIHAGDFRAVLIEHDDGIDVCIRGTQDVHNWFTDADANLVPFVAYIGDRCHVHAGFMSALDALETQIDVALASHPGRVFVCGHSLGGAVGIGYALRRPVDLVYTFGQPRFGDSSCAHIINTLYFDTMWRIVNDLDPVPRVPPLGIGYSHGGNIALLRDGQILFPAQQGNETLVTMATHIGEHMIDKYQAAL